MGGGPRAAGGAPGGAGGPGRRAAPGGAHAVVVEAALLALAPGLEPLVAGGLASERTPRGRLMREYRCRSCGRLLFRSPDQHGRVEIVCPDRRCRAIQTVFLEPETRERPRPPGDTGLTPLS